jgi:hypothetical protein
LAYIYYHSDLGTEIDGKYIELRCGSEKNEGCMAAGNLELPNWEFMRTRDDRAREKTNYFGNDFKTAEINWSNYLAPFDENQLWDGPDAGYFITAKSTIYKQQTAFTSFVKTQIIESLSHCKWVVDAAVGKGQDFLRYVAAGVRYLVGIDIDQIALTELVRRKLQNAGKNNGRDASNPLTLYILSTDLTNPYKKTADKVKSIMGFPEKGADALVINLAIHYFCGTVKHIQNFIHLCASLVAPDGTVSLTAMFGETVHKLLMDNNVDTGGAWKKYQGDVMKYSVRRDYKTDTITDVGQKIGVLLPFSVGEYYTEFLVNTEYLATQFDLLGFDMVERVPFNEYFEIYKARNPSRYKMLTPEDLEFLSLYGKMTFKKRI